MPASRYFWLVFTECWIPGNLWIISTKNQNPEPELQQSGPGMWF